MIGLLYSGMLIDISFCKGADKETTTRYKFHHKSKFVVYLSKENGQANIFFSFMLSLKKRKNTGKTLSVRVTRLSGPSYTQKPTVR